MTNFYLWRRGLHGPCLVKLLGEDRLVEYDRSHKLHDPKPIAPEHDKLSLTELAEVYPPPKEATNADAPALELQRSQPVQDL